MKLKRQSFVGLEAGMEAGPKALSVPVNGDVLGEAQSPSPEGRELSLWGK